MKIIASEFCSSVRDGTHDSPKEVLSGGKPLVTTKHLKGGNIDFDNTYNISEEDFEKINKRSKVDKWDVLISMIGTVGEVYLVDKEPDYAIKNLGLFKVGDEINSKWLYFYLKSKIGQNQIRFLLQGSTQQYISLKSLRGFPLFVPNDDKEKEIVVNFLSALESKIKTNQRMNETLEEIAKTLFKSWFIDFDPVRAKAEGRPTGLSKEISDLFPNSFEDSELGEIPKGWEVKALDEIAEFLNGLALQKYPEDEERPRYPVLKIAQLRAGSIKSQNVFSSNVPDEYIVRNGDYIFSWSGSLLAKFWLGGDVALNQHLFKVTSQNYPKWFFAGWVEKYLDMFSSVATSKATTMGHIKRSDLKDAKTVVPPIELISSFGEYFSPLREKANLCFLENKILTEIRDTLLPKLISGELKIPDAENLVGKGGI